MARKKQMDFAGKLFEDMNRKNAERAEQAEHEKTATEERGADEPATETPVPVQRQKVNTETGNPRTQTPANEPATGDKPVPASPENGPKEAGKATKQVKKTKKKTESKTTVSKKRENANNENARALITDEPVTSRYSEDGKQILEKDGITIRVEELRKSKTPMFSREELLVLKKRASWYRMSLSAFFEFIFQIDKRNGGVEAWADMPDGELEALIQKNGTYGKGTRTMFHVSEEVAGYIKEIGRYTALKDVTIMHAVLEKYIFEKEG